MGHLIFFIVHLMIVMSESPYIFITITLHFIYISAQKSKVDRSKKRKCLHCESFLKEKDLKNNTCRSCKDEINQKENLSKNFKHKKVKTIEYISISALARKHEIKPTDLFSYFSYKKLIKREDKYLVLTPKGKELGGELFETEDGSKWTRWKDDFPLDDFISIKSKIDKIPHPPASTTANSSVVVEHEDKKIVIRILSNSMKEGGRCIAGVQIDPITSKFFYYKKTKKLVWVRPVCRTVHEQVPNNLARDIKIGDIIEFKYDPSYSRRDYQNENKLILNDELKIIKNKSLSNSELKYLSRNNYSYIFDDSKRSIINNNISNINYSLMLVEVANPIVIKKSSYNSRMQYRLKFRYKNNNYDLPITDDDFILKYIRDNSILDNKNEIYLIASLGVEFNSAYWKLIATIFY